MFLAGSPAKWTASKPLLQGLGAAPTEDGISVDVLFVNGTTRARLVNVALYQYATKAPLIVRIRNPRLLPGLYEEVKLHGRF